MQENGGISRLAGRSERELWPHRRFERIGGVDAAFKTMGKFSVHRLNSQLPEGGIEAISTGNLETYSPSFVLISISSYVAGANWSCESVHDRSFHLGSDSEESVE